MIEFKELKEEVLIIKDFIDNNPSMFCDLTLGVKHMWRDEFIIDYAIFNDTLILKEKCKDYSCAFYYPLGKDPEGALLEIENWCKKTHTPLKFCYLNEKQLDILKERYPFCESYYLREWSDYIYSAEDFKTFSGKKYSGQRNHINKFIKTYPQYVVKEIVEEDLDKISEFLKAFERGTDFSVWSEREEQRKVLDSVKKTFNLKKHGVKFKGVAIWLEDKIIAFSIGEVVGDVLFVHIEKGLKQYSGIYPMLANVFAKFACDESVKIINREEDCGDEGLKISKSQYHPIDILHKHILDVSSAFDKIVSPIKIQCEELSIEEFTFSDMEEYTRLSTDKTLNRFWGYDYEEDLKGEKADEQYFWKFINLLKSTKEEYPLAIKLGNKLLGEVTIHNFGHFEDCEVGFRIFKDFQGKSIAYRSVRAVVDKLFNDFGMKKVKTRCNKQNVRSFNLINRLNFKKESEDSECYYFSQKNS